MSNANAPKINANPGAAKTPRPLSDDQLDRVAGGARPSLGKPIIIVGG